MIHFRNQTINLRKSQISQNLSLSWGILNKMMFQFHTIILIRKPNYLYNIESPLLARKAIERIKSEKEVELRERIEFSSRL